MYKVLLVDDEAIVREGIESTIDWGALGYEFSGSYDNGADAARAAFELRPDAVITDICMPFGDGLELAEILADRLPETKVILLTGYDEFEYARRALRLGAYDYVLKPITAAELRTLLERLRKDLDSAATQSARMRAISRELELARDARFRQLTESILDAAAGDSGLESSAILTELQDLGVRLAERPGIVFVESGDKSHAEAGYDGSEERGNRFSFTDHERRRVSILCAETGAKALTEAKGAAELICAAAAGGSTVGIGEPFLTPAGFARSYREAVCALGYRFIAGLGRVIEHRDVPPQARRQFERSSPCGGEWSPRFRSAASALARSLRSCDAHECIAALELISAEMRERFVSAAQSRLQVHAVLVPINDIREELGEEPISIELFDALPTLDQVLSRLQHICSSVIEAQIESRETYRGSKTEEALRYIDEHYASPTLTLSSLCAAIGVSSSYFSSIFKSHTGKTFVEHLTGIRLDRAKHLLKSTDLRSYEVAERVGYHDQHYFCTIFKKATGRSPMEFRREGAPTGRTG